MQKTAPQSTISQSALETAELPRYIQSHLNDARIRQLSPRTIHERGIYLSKLVWFQQHNDYSHCDALSLREFFTYLTIAHEEPGDDGETHASANPCARSQFAATTPNTKSFLTGLWKNACSKRLP